MSFDEITRLAVDFLLIVLLSVALYTDLTRRKIYDWATLPAIGVGLLLGGVQAVQVGQWYPFTQNVLGLCIGFFVFLFVGIVGGMGGGDIKMMAALGALGGLPFLILATLYTTLIGGIMAVAYLLIKREFVRFWGYYLMRMLRFFSPRFPLPQRPKSVGSKMPYGVAIVIGSFYTLLTKWGVAPQFFF